MDEPNNTEERILTAFLELAGERGFEAVTTREIACRAGVNPVTLFRRFGDKKTIAVEAIRRSGLRSKLQGWDPAVDPANAREDLVSCLLLLVEQRRDFRTRLGPGLLQVSSIPEVQAEVSAMWEAGYDYLRRMLAQAAPALRPEVDHHVTTLQWMGLMITVSLRAEFRAATEPEPEDWRALFTAAVRPLLRDPGE